MSALNEIERFVSVLDQGKVARFQQSDLHTLRQRNQRKGVYFNTIIKIESKYRIIKGWLSLHAASETRSNLFIKFAARHNLLFQFSLRVELGV